MIISDIKNKNALAIRIISIISRLVFVVLAFYIDSNIARQLLYYISFIYLWQIISGFEIYLNAEKNLNEHMGLVITNLIIIIPIFFIIILFKELSLILLILLFFDFLIVEYSRKESVKNNIIVTAQINLFRSLFFGLSVLLIPLISLDLVILINAFGSLILCFIYKIFNSKFIKFSSFTQWFIAIREVGKKAIPIAVVNRSIDVILREVNSAYDFFGTVLDLCLSYCGVANVILFYLFIAPKAESYIKGYSRPGLNKYMLSISLYIFGVLASLISIFIYDIDFLSDHENITFNYISLLFLLLQYFKLPVEFTCSVDKNNIITLYFVFVIFSNSFYRVQ